MNAYFDQDGYQALNGYDALNGYNAEDEGDYDGDTEEEEVVGTCDICSCEMCLCDIKAQKRDEFIYTQVFNNYRIPTETPIDFNLGTIEEWGLTCSTFNNPTKDLLSFATIYIVYDTLYCNNVHPFLEEQPVNNLVNLFSAHVINN
jgi:hypothetical protein